MLTMKKHKKDFIRLGAKFQYMMLGRMKSDCDYFLGYGGRYEGRLWACNAKDQIKYMKYLYRLVPLKPEWISKKDIREYRKKMTNRRCKLGKKEEFKKTISKQGIRKLIL